MHGLAGYDQAGSGADGFQEIFTASMMASLEWGMYPYAKSVLDNWLTYFLGKRGFVRYRGLMGGIRPYAPHHARHT